MTAHQPIVEASAPVRAEPLAWTVRLAAIAAVSFYFHSLFWQVVPPDLKLFLFPWYDHILQKGPIGAFAETFSNYTPTYLYLLAAASPAHTVLSPMALIKSLSVAGTVFLALAVADLVKAMGTDAKRAALVLVLPTAVLNTSLLAQCDALWAGSCVLAVAAMIRGRTAASLAWCGVAIAFKAQSAFIAPFMIGALIGRRAPLWQWLIPPLVYAAFMLPAWLLGWPAADLALVYFRQVGCYEDPGDLTNPWAWGQELAPQAAQHVYVLGYLAAAAVAVAIGVLASRSTRKPAAMLALALLSAMALPFLLPKMHERYFFLADVLAIALALARPKRETVVVAIAVQLASLAAITCFVFNWAPLLLVGSLISAMAIAAICQYATMTGVDWSLRRVTGSVAGPGSA